MDGASDRDGNAAASGGDAEQAPGASGPHTEGGGVQGRVKLSPYRTFREVAWPESEFVFRLRSRGGGVPECALFEADGGKWKLDEVVTIETWLDAQNLNIPVIA
jgi:hypothetical protein